MTVGLPTDRQTMDSPTLSELYALGIGGFLVVLLSYRLASLSWDYFQRRPLSRLRRITTLAYLVRRHRYIGPVTTSSLIVWLLYIGVNTFFALYRVRSLDDVAHRLALLARGNMVLLYLGSQLAFAAEFVGLNVKRFDELHRAAGCIVTAEAAGHVLIHVSQHDVDPNDAETFFGILAACCIAATLCTTVLKRFVYELTIKLHYALAVTLLYTTWRHHRGDSWVDRTPVYVIASVFLLSTTCQVFRILYRNLTFGSSAQKAWLVRHRGVANIRIPLRRGWKVKPGQFVQLWVPGVTSWSIIQTHPFMICWWENDRDGTALSISLLVAGRRPSSITNRLVKTFCDPHRQSTPFTAWIDGPFDTRTTFSAYGTVVLLATGIGIAAQLPHVKNIVRACSSYESKTRRLCLVWELDDEDDVDWAKPWLDEILKEDEFFILHIQLYNRPRRANHGNHDRLTESDSRLTAVLDDILSDEIRRRRGKVVVHVSAQSSTHDRAREIVVGSGESMVEFCSASFQPFETAEPEQASSRIRDQSSA